MSIEEIAEETRLASSSSINAIVNFSRASVPIARPKHLGCVSAASFPPVPFLSRDRRCRVARVGESTVAPCERISLPGNPRRPESPVRGAATGPETVTNDRDKQARADLRRRPSRIPPPSPRATADERRDPAYFGPRGTGWGNGPPRTPREPRLRPRRGLPDIGVPDCLTFARNRATVFTIPIR